MADNFPGNDLAKKQGFEPVDARPRLTHLVSGAG